MSAREGERLKVLHEVQRGHLKQVEAAVRRRLSVRQVRRRAVHLWRERRAAFGELVMMDSSPFRWLEEREPELQLMALTDDATSRCLALCRGRRARLWAACSGAQRSSPAAGSKPNCRFEMVSDVTVLCRNQ